jgi:hypothetical protein
LRQYIHNVYNTSTHAEEVVMAKLPAENPEIETVMGIYKAADWYERELSEMFDIKIIGRKTKRLLLEKWNGVEAPLRKSFAWGNPNYKREQIMATMRINIGPIHPSTHGVLRLVVDVDGDTIENVEPTCWLSSQGSGEAHGDKNVHAKPLIY